jgi:hypothetical protein
MLKHYRNLYLKYLSTEEFLQSIGLNRIAKLVCQELHLKYIQDMMDLSDEKLMD